MNISLEIGFWDKPCEGVAVAPWRHFSASPFDVNPAFARFSHSLILFSRGLPLAACAIVRQFAGFGKKNTRTFGKHMAYSWLT